MIESTIKMIKLQAEEGMVLTNGDSYSSIGGSVYLGINDNPSNWYEITAEEYENYKRIMDELSREGIE